MGEASGIDINQTMSCGKGTEDGYNVFMFPYLEFEEEDEGLTAAEIAAIVLCPLFVIGIAVAAFFLWRRRKANGGSLDCALSDCKCPNFSSMKCCCSCPLGRSTEGGKSKSTSS